MSDLNIHDEGFRIDTLEKAALVMRKYRALAQRMEENKALAQAERDRIDDWLTRVNGTISESMEWYEGHLKAFAMSRRAEGQKSVNLPDGEIKTRETSPTFEVDKARFLEWAQDQKRDDVLRVTLAPDMKAIKSSFVTDGGAAVDPATGEVVPGLLPVPQSITVSLIPDMSAQDLEEDDGV